MFKKVYAENLQDLGRAKFQAQFRANDDHQDVDADGDPELSLHRVIAGAIEVLDTKVLFDPLEEQFDSPPQLVELGNR